MTETGNSLLRVLRPASRKTNPFTPASDIKERDAALRKA